MPDPRRARPPEPALRWAAAAIGPGSRVVSVRRLTAGGWLANHALTVLDGRGATHRLILRRWARPGWEVDDPDFTAAREAAVLALLADANVPSPRLVAADPEGRACDVPALLLTRLPGGPPDLPDDMEAFLTQLAEALPPIHAIDADGRVPPYRTYHDHGAASPPEWSPNPALWERALAIAAEPPPPGHRCLIHRDYHPENTLWRRERLTGIVDWTAASFGPAAVDVGHMRWNLAVTYGLDAADTFLELAEHGDDQPYWDLVTALDMACVIDPADPWPAFDLQRLERYVESVLAG
jgi:aminoglycoside phosphotransferase (APT) family kinase protein